MSIIPNVNQRLFLCLQQETSDLKEMLEKVQSQMSVMKRHLESHKAKIQKAERQGQVQCSPARYSTPQREAMTKIIEKHLWSSPNNITSETPSPFLSSIKEEISRSISSLLMGESPTLHSKSIKKSTSTFKSPFTKIPQMHRNATANHCVQQLLFDDATMREELAEERHATEIPSTDSGYSSLNSSLSQSQDPVTATPKIKDNRRRLLAKQLKHIGKQLHKDGFKNLNMDLLAVL